MGEGVIAIFAIVIEKNFNEWQNGEYIPPYSPLSPSILRKIMTKAKKGEDGQKGEKIFRHDKNRNCIDECRKAMTPPTFMRKRYSKDKLWNFI